MLLPRKNSKTNSVISKKRLRPEKSQSFFYSAAVKHFLIALLLCFIVVPILYAADEEKYGDAIVTASISDARILIPILASDTASSQICSQLFNGLIKYDKYLRIIGDLAERWEVSDDGKTITFFLRKNAAWHDGHPCTARDVEFTYRRLIDPATATPYSGDFLMVERFEVLDDYSFTVTYKEPFAPGLSSWGMSIIPEHLFKDQNLQTTPLRRNPTGTGPYKFKSWKSQERIELIYNNNYFEGRPYISRYFNRVIPDEASSFIELQTQAVDYTNLSPIAFQFKTDTPFFKKTFNKFRLPGFGYTFLGYNLKSSLFENQNVRVALDYAVDKEEIIKIIFFGLAKPLTGPFIVGSWAYNQNVAPREFDPEKAKLLLSREGWRDSDADGILDKEGRRFEFTITTNQGNEQRIKTAEVIQKRLGSIGIKVKIKVLEWSVFLSECVDKRNFDAVLLGWSLALDPDPFDIWHSSKTKEGEFNFIGYRNEKVDALILAGRRTFDQKEREKIHHEIHETLFREQPYMFLYAPDALVIVNKRFNGINPGPAGIGHNFIRWWVEKNQRRYKDLIEE